MEDNVEKGVMGAYAPATLETSALALNGSRTDDKSGLELLSTNRAGADASDRKEDLTDGPASASLPSPLPTPTDVARKRALPKPMNLQPEEPAPDGQSHGSSSELSADSKSIDEGSSESAVSAHEPEPLSKSSSKQSIKTHAPEGVRRLSASKIQALTGAPDSLPVAPIPDRAPADYHPMSAGLPEPARDSIGEHMHSARQADLVEESETLRSDGTNPRVLHTGRPNISTRTLSTPPVRRKLSASSGSQPGSNQTFGTRRNSFHPYPRPAPLDLDNRDTASNPPSSKFKLHPVTTSSRPEVGGDTGPPSPIPTAIPLPPMSIPTVLQLELAGARPSLLYIHHHSHIGDAPYESYAVKLERLKNFLVLPTYLERTMNFGALACLDAWLWTFTILPMRFLAALSVLARWWVHVVRKEAYWLLGFVWYGLGRLWIRNRPGRGRTMSRTTSYDSTRSSNAAGDQSRSRSRAPSREAERVNGVANISSTNNNGLAPGGNAEAPVPRRTESSKPNGRIGASTAQSSSHKKATAKHSSSTATRHRRVNSVPSALTTFNKADLLQGLIIICSSAFLMNLDASRMYHFIRAQSAMKLYVIYNVLEVGDRLLSALGQDIFECLLSEETLSRNALGRSKVLLPFGMFILALVYNISHSVALFYQVTTLNVAVNSYSNALLTLLISNQFVEIKSSVFKRFEKENTFQLTCADIVERFQMWIMLLIIGMRNVVEVGGLSVPGAGSDNSGGGPGGDDFIVPLHSAANMPDSFTLLPSWLLSGEVLSPFLIVVGSEMFVDWIKHAYINKFNNIKPNFYSRILDILCKDYYTNAFVTPSLTRRLGLPVLPLSCLFIRASVQTYHMFLATHLPTPLPPSSQTSLSVEAESASPSSLAIIAGLDRVDHIIRSALGRAVHGYPYGPEGEAEALNATVISSGWLSSLWPARRWTSDDAIAAVTMVVVFLLLFLVLLVFKLILGMLLLRYSRERYAATKAHEAAVAAGKTEREGFDAKGKRVGGYGQVEIGEERLKRIYADDPDGLRKARNRVRREAEKGTGSESDFSGVKRYEMIAKRIW